MSTQTFHSSTSPARLALRIGTGVAGLALTLLSAAVSAQSLPPSWAQSWLAPTKIGASDPISSAATPDGGFIQLTHSVSSPNQTHPVGVVQYDANGQLRWTQFDVSADADISINPAIAVGNNGTASVVFRNKLSFSQSEIVIRSYQLSSGQLRWEQRVPELDSFSRSKYAVQMLSNNEVAVVHRDLGDITLSRISDTGTQLPEIRYLTPGSDDLSEHAAVASATGGLAIAFVSNTQDGEAIVHLIRYSANGVLELDQSDSGGVMPCIQFPASLRQDGNGNLLLGRGTFTPLPNNTGRLGYRLQKRSASGQPLWTRNDVNFPANDFAVNASGEIALVRADFDHINVAKISASGHVLWTRQYHGDQGYARLTDAALSLSPTGDVRITSFNQQTSPGSNVAHVIEWRDEGALCTDTVLQTVTTPLLRPQQFIEQSDAWAITGTSPSNPVSPSAASIFRFASSHDCTAEKFMNESFEAVEQPVSAPDGVAP